MEKVKILTKDVELVAKIYEEHKNNNDSFTRYGRLKTDVLRKEYRKDTNVSKLTRDHKDKLKLINNMIAKTK
jgi:hypothetical protein